MYESTRRVLASMEQQGHATILDVLNVFRELCNDIAGSGSTVETLPVGDPDEAVTAFCNTARTVARLATKNEAIFVAPDSSSRWKRASAKLEEARKRTEQLEAESEKYRRAIEALEIENRKGAAQEGELRRLQQEYEQKRELAGRYEEKCEELRRETADTEAQIRNLKETVLPHLSDLLESVRQNAAPLSARKRELTEQSGQLQLELGQLQRDVEDQEAALAAEKVTLEKERKRLSDLKEQLARTLDAELENEAAMADVKAQISQHDKTAEKAEWEVQQLREVILPQKQQKEQEKQEMLGALQRQNEELDAQIAGMESAGKQLLEKYETRKAALEQEHGVRMDSEQRIESQLRQQEERQKKDLRKKQEEKAALQERIRQNESELQSLAREKSRLSEQAAKQDRQKRELEQKLEQCMRDCSRLRDDRADVHARLDGMKKESESLNADMQDDVRLVEDLWRRLQREVTSDFWPEAETDKRYTVMQQYRVQLKEDYGKFVDAYRVLIQYLETR